MPCGVRWRSAAPAADGGSVSAWVRSPAWRSCACSRRPARPPAPGVTTARRRRSATCSSAARQRYGSSSPTCWRRAGSGSTAIRPPTRRPVGPADEVAVLPPVSGGAAMSERDARASPRPRRARRPGGGSCRSSTTPCPTSAGWPRAGPTWPAPSWPGAAPATRRELTDELATCSATACSATSDRPPRPADDFSDHPRAAELDQLCADHGFGRLAELDDRRARRAGRRPRRVRGPGVERAPRGVRRARRPDRRARPPLPRAERGATTDDDGTES